MTEPVGDVFAPRPVVARYDRFDGLRWTVVTDEVALPGGETVPRDYLVHPGAVGIVAVDERDRVLFVHQYRHPVAAVLWEPPAGLMDLHGESALATAQRELLEEAGIVATDWHVLADWYNSPGGSSEAFRCFLARGLSDAPGGRPAGEAEEADMPLAWVDLDEALGMVLGGRLGNPTAVCGVLAAWAARAREWDGLRPADAPWQAREHLLAEGRVWLPSS